MHRAPFTAALGRDTRGSVIIEFAVLAPVLFIMMFGVLTMGLHLFNVNALQAAGSDTARWAMIEYQKANKVTVTQVEDKAEAVMISAPYSLKFNRLTATAQTVTTDITGTTKFKLDLTYSPYNPLEFAGVRSPTITNTRYFYVAT